MLLTFEHCAARVCGGTELEVLHVDQRYFDLAAGLRAPPHVSFHGLYCTSAGKCSFTSAGGHDFLRCGHLLLRLSLPAGEQRIL